MLRDLKNNAIMPMAISPFTPLILLTFGERVQSAPVLLCPIPSSMSNVENAVNDDLNLATASKITTEENIVPDVDNSFDVTRRDFWHEVPGRIKMHDKRASTEEQERRRLFERRGRLHRVVSKFLAKASNTNAPAVLRRRRHSTSTLVVERANALVQDDRHGEGQDAEQAQVAKPSRRKSLLSRARSLRGVKSLSDLRVAARKGDKGKGQSGYPQTRRNGQVEGVFECAVVRMKSVHSATSAPLYFFRGAE
ncbi:hypothetical protein E4T38_09913 [Aureobasidium subglaciale]|nr:hypothetical protein E4T38_09913 [Aureobasidium subglaciale]KAI5214348.1 hypothetical protein E4T41_09926 [Aureobasidium subglaciale]KAI5215412.1 hypothetical protein E4T40_08442 [Aureobasidium subglaciale]KAI5252488.1 hypothetical protein E4T46_09913 [Aureobasidium subglaciale]